MGKSKYESTSRSKIRAITDKANRKGKQQFTSLMHLFNEEYLEECFRELKAKAAPGIDGITTKAYEQEVFKNLKGLVERLKARTYRPQPVRRVYIQKPDKKEQRPLGIPATEDKIVQMGLKNIIQAIFEPIFLKGSHGFRPGRSCHTAITQLHEAVRNNPINYVVEVDIKKFFDTVDHYWLIRCIEERVNDPSLMRYIRRFLKAGVIETGKWRTSEEGTPQGGIISPLFANIYLHYVVDLWFEVEFKSKAQGYCELVRYADDFVALCQTERDADRFLKELDVRLDKFGLKISQEKTKKIEFGRKAWYKAQRTKTKVPTFDFLGFTHYCDKSRKGYFMVKHKTAKTSFARKLKGISQWLCTTRTLLSPKDWWNILSAKLRGHYNYFGINGNMRSLSLFYYRVIRMVFKWINKRSQKRSMTWSAFGKYLKLYPLPLPKTMHQIWI